MSKNKTNSGKDTSQVKFLARYAGMAFQMLAIMLMGVGLGFWMDNLLQTQKPWFLFIFTVIFVLLALYYSLKDFIRMK
jgi:F0F1-type ATP synthase assembly protein I